MVPNRFNASNVVRALRRPRLLAGEAHLQATRFNGRVQRAVLGTSGLDVAAADWDLLVILDACRYDYFEAMCTLPGELSAVTSRGSQSEEWLVNNFEGRELHDTVYVSPNAYAPVLSDGTFHAADLFADEGVDETARAILPETVTERALAAARRYPRKRLIVHYMQPHTPYIGETGEQIPHRGPDPDREGFTPADEVRGLWTNIRYGLADVDMELVRRAYRENLRIVLEEVRDLLEAVEGKAVISSDHGELFGERLWPIPIRGYGHPKGVRHRHLVRVPWHELPVTERRDVVSEPPEAVTRPDESDVEDRLAALGYR